jgi:hypothetical protein
MARSCAATEAIDSISIEIVTFLIVATFVRTSPTAFVTAAAPAKWVGDEIEAETVIPTPDTNRYAESHPLFWPSSTRVKDRPRFCLIGRIILPSMIID